MFKYPAYRVDRLITKLGVPVSLIQTAQTYDPVTGAMIDPTETVFNVIGIVSVMELDFENKTDLAATILDVLISNTGLGTVPAVGDQVAMNGITYRVLRVEPGYIASTIASWYLSVQG